MVNIHSRQSWTYFNLSSGEELCDGPSDLLMISSISNTTMAPARHLNFM